jgi:hypothetical protein
LILASTPSVDQDDTARDPGIETIFDTPIDLCSQFVGVNPLNEPVQRFSGSLHYQVMGARFAWKCLV